MFNGEAYDTLCDKFEPYVVSALRDAPPPSAALAILFRTLNPDVLKEKRIELATECIATSWSEALRWTFKEQGMIQLFDYLLPKNLGRAKAAWDGNLTSSPALKGGDSR